MRRVLPLLVLLSALNAHAQTVTRVSAVAKPKNHNGRCPAEMKFIGTIRVSRYPVPIEYVWERSDGAKSAPQRVVIRSAGQAVNDYWTLGTRGQRVNIWERLHILAPTNVRSPRAPAHVTCR